MYHNPKLGLLGPDPGTPADPDPTNDAVGRGHRTLPWAGNLCWYEAIRADRETHLLDESDFYDMFQHIDGPLD